MCQKLVVPASCGRTLMIVEGLVTVLVGHAETPQLFHTHCPFASGAALESPVRGVATSAHAGYLRDLDWPHGGAIDLIQGEDVGMRSGAPCRHAVDLGKLHSCFRRRGNH